MSSWHDQLPASDQLEALAARIEENPLVLAVILVGSWAHGVSTEYSDIDLLVVLDREDGSWWRKSTDGVDVSVITLDRLAQIPADPGRWWDRYSYCHAKVLLDRSENKVATYLHAWATLTPDETVASVDFHIDGYLTYAYRSLKSHREGRTREARLDACESLPWAISMLFSVHGRVRPSNKYLYWELKNAALPGGNTAERVSRIVDAVLDDGSARAQRDMFALVEPQARALGFGGVIDSFGSGVELLRRAS